MLRAADKMLKAGGGDSPTAQPQQTAPSLRLAARQAGSKGSLAAQGRTATALASGRRSKISASRIRKTKRTDAEEGTENEATPISRKELLERALQIIAADLNLEGGQRPTNTIGSLVQLLKLDRSFREDEEQPHEIRVVWQEKRNETIDDSAEKASET